MLSIAPSEAAVERAFSHRKLIHSNIRNSLADASVEVRLMLESHTHFYCLMVQDKPDVGFDVRSHELHPIECFLFLASGPLFQMFQSEPSATDFSLPCNG